MPYHRRNKKRHRNKSSPQILSSPKKYRQSKPDCHETTELTTELTELSDSGSDSDSESVVDSTDNSILNSTMNDNIQAATMLQPNVSVMISEHNIDMSQSYQRDVLIAHQVDTQQQFANATPQFVGSAGQGMMDPNMDPNMMHSAHPLNFNPQQMLNFSQSMPHPHMHMQPFSQAPPYSRMSEDDILRVASKMKMLLRDEINDLIQQQVALVVAPLKMELDTVKASLAKVEKAFKDSVVRNDDLEQYSRRSCLRITGIAETVNEDVSKIVLDLARRVNANIRPQDIDRTHRVGRPNDTDVENDRSDEPRQPRRAREIIIKFTNTSARLQLLKGRAVLREENARIYINEDLTKTRRDLAYECRRLKKAKRIDKTWVYNGNVFIKDNSDSKLRITSLEDLDPFKPDTNDNDEHSDTQ